MSSFKPTNNRFSSLNDDTNTFSAPNHTNRDKGTSNQSFRQPRENRDNGERYDNRSRQYNENRSFSARPRITKPKEFSMNESLFPSINEPVIVSEKDVKQVPENDTDVPMISDYLQKCTKNKEAAVQAKLNIGWTSFRQDKQTNKVMYSNDDNNYFPIEDYISDQNDLREEEYKAELDETITNMWNRHYQNIQDDYDMYGEDSITYQEHCRFQQYLIDYPEDCEGNVDENDGSDYDSYED